MTTDDRLAIADRLIQTFQDHPSVHHAFLRGSLAHNTADQYSDIDICVDVSGHDNGQFLLAIPDLLASSFPILFYDWSPSLLPDTYIISLYLDGLPIFWNVDIQSFAKPHVPSVTHIECNQVDHFLKLWILNAKYCLRGKPDSASIQHLARRVLSPNVYTSHTNCMVMEIIFTHITDQARPSYSSFLKECQDVLVELKKCENK